MTNQEPIDILTRYNAWRRDNKTEFPELPDSPVLIGEAIDTAIQGLEKLERMRHESNLNPKTLRQLRIEDDLAQALILLRAIAKIRYRTPASPEEAEESNNTMVKIYNFLAKLE